MFCPKCGKSNEEDALFCFNCGTGLEGVDVFDEENAPADCTDKTENGSTATIDAAKPSEDSPEIKTETEDEFKPDTESSTSRATGGTPEEEVPSSVPEPVATPSPATKENLQNAVAKISSNKRTLAIAVAAIAVILIGGFAWYNLSGAGVLGQTQDTFKQAFSLSTTATKGIASDQYVSDSAYKVTNFSCESIKKVSDYEVVADIKAVIENDNFKTEITARGEYYDAGKAPSYLLKSTNNSYSFDITSSNTTPKKGIDFDTAHGLSDCNASLSEDALSCTVEIEEISDLWFVKASGSHVYEYKFDGKAWNFSNDDQQITFAYKEDLEGSYNARTGSLTNLSNFTISNLDTEKGTFDIDYSFDRTGESVGPDTLSGTLNVAINTSAGTWLTTPKVNDITYSIEGKGTSDSGNQQASIKGALTVGVSGEPSITISSMRADYEYSTRWSSTNQNGTQSAYGELYKQ